MGVGFGVPAAKTVATRLIRAAAEKTRWAGQARDSTLVSERQREQTLAPKQITRSLLLIQAAAPRPPPI